MSDLGRILPANALADVCLGLSVSGSEDLERLGMAEAHFRLAVAEITRSVVVSGGKIAYGGHLDPNGYTSLLMNELHRYGRRDKPLAIYLAWHEHRRIALTELKKEQDSLGLCGSISCLDEKGNTVLPALGRAEAPEIINDKEVIQRGLSSLRHYMLTVTHGRIFIGGRRTGYSGKMPGLIEEALLSVRNKHPIFLAGGFGGVTLDIAGALRIPGADWALKGKNTKDTGHDNGMRELVGLNKFSLDALNNGLNEDENRVLMTTPRPSEVAALVSLGLGRLFSSRGS